MRHFTDILHWHGCSGIGAAAAGFNMADVTVNNLTARFRCIGGVDNDPAAVRDFQRLTGVPGTLLDLFDRDQYIAWHDHAPPEDWCEATPEDIRRSAGGEYPNLAFSSSPCKGYSGLIAESVANTRRYHALNRLALRSVWLALEAWADEPPEFFLIENVPRIAQRGRHLLDQLNSLFLRYGYAAIESTHDCGVIGELAQSRKRFLMVARHIAKVRPFLYEPRQRPLQSVGSVLGRMPMPSTPSAGVMHRLPSLQWRTWMRLAFVEAGKDWRCLSPLDTDGEHLRDYVLTPESTGSHHLAIQPVDALAPAASALPIIDPRPPVNALQYQQYGVRRWSDTSGAIIGVKSPGQGTFSVADPRPITHLSSTGALSTLAADHAARTITDVPLPNQHLACVIRSLDGTWHRPYTTLELAALQSLVDPEEVLELDGTSDQAWRERIGNAVPPAAARAIAEVIGRTILMARTGTTFFLSSEPIWVRPIALAATLPSPLQCLQDWMTPAVTVSTTTQ